MTSTFNGQECFIWNTWLKNVWIWQCCCSSELFPSEVRSVYARVHDWVRRLTQNSWMTWDWILLPCHLYPSKAFSFLTASEQQLGRKAKWYQQYFCQVFSLFSWYRLFSHFYLKISKGSKKQRERSPTWALAALGWAGWDREGRADGKVLLNLKHDVVGRKRGPGAAGSWTSEKRDGSHRGDTELMLWWN